MVGRRTEWIMHSNGTAHTAAAVERSKFSKGRNVQQASIACCSDPHHLHGKASLRRWIQLLQQAPPLTFIVRRVIASSTLPARST